MGPVRHGDMGEIEHVTFRHPVLLNILDSAVVHPGIIVLLQRELNPRAPLADLVGVNGDDQLVERLHGKSSYLGMRRCPCSIMCAPPASTAGQDGGTSVMTAISINQA